MRDMSTRLKVFRLFVALLMLAFLIWIGCEVFSGRYLHAVAISGTGSLLMWFAMGLGKQPKDSP
jgi:hypothetical protein